MILTADPIDAWHAERIGLVNTVVPHRRLLDEANAFVERIIRHPPTSVLACMRAVTRGINLPIDEALEVEASWLAAAAPSQGVKQGIDAFLHRTSAARRRT